MVKPKARFSIVRVVLTLLLAATVMLLAVLWGYYDVGNRIERWLLPPLVEATGRVYLDSVPLKNAQIFTRPVQSKCRGAMAETDAEGRFALRTDVNGDFLPGAYAGEHRVIVLGFDPNARPGPFRPPLVTPSDCSEFETTPLRIQVDRDPARNQIEFRLERKPAAEGS
jgi:hypothetical protein